MKSYCFKKKNCAAPVTCDWNDSYWQGCNVADIDIVYDRSSDHHPVVKGKFAHDDRHIYGIYQVQDRYIRAVAKKYQDSVCQDSCVEFFLKPSVGPGYFNLEMGAGGTYLFYYVIDNSHSEKGGFKNMIQVPWEDGCKIKLKTTLPKIIEPEITTPTTWCAQFSIPLSMLEKYTGKIGKLSGQNWTGNFYKCADKTSHPHWLSWNRVSTLNFHLPECFGQWLFE